MPLFLKMIPFKDYVLAAAVVALVVFYNVHVHDLEVAYSAQRVAAVEESYKKGSDDALKAAQKLIADKERQHEVDLSQVEDNYERLIQKNDAAHAADASRLRQRATDSEQRANAVLQGAGGANSGAGGGDQGLSGLGLVPGWLGLELADALRQDDASLSECYDERDRLTGK